MNSIRFIYDYENQTTEAFNYWKENNCKLLHEKKQKLEEQLKLIDRLLTENEHAKSYSDVVIVYGDVQKLN